MCKSQDFALHLAKVPDFVFAATEERWDVNKCESCKSLFLAGRPDRASIGRYYQRYYTHSDEADTASISGISIQSGAAKKLANSWRNHLYKVDRPSFGWAGVAMISAMPPLQKWIDAECRHLADATDAPRKLRVLDIGHGDGRFLKFVQEAGHEAHGVEIDPKAVEQARKLGLDSRQGDIDAALAEWGEGTFDYLTMSHVIEHVHDPVHVIQAANRLLKPGGYLWIEWPNPEAPGLHRYGSFWRDLDPPRHICIPSLNALQKVAAEEGFELCRSYRRPFVPFEVYPFSARAQGKSKAQGYLDAAIAEVKGTFSSRNKEWLTVSFRKSKAEPSN